MKQTDSQTRLKSLLRELFQLDVADLDFGLYRLFRLKRAEVEAFLNKQLPAEVDRTFAAAAGAEREALQKRVDDLAERTGVAFVQRSVFLDNQESEAAIRQRLLELASAARAQGEAVGIGHDRPAMMAALEKAVPALEKAGYTLVRVSELAESPSRR